MEDTEPKSVAGFVEPSVQLEFPGLRLDWLTVPGGDRRSPSTVINRLKGMSNRFRGTTVVSMRTLPIPRAYRAFFRQIGLDPDTTRIPVEELALLRLMQGGFTSTGLVDDALKIALIETSVPIWAIDADRVGEGGLGIRTSVEGDRLGSTEYGDYLAPGRLVVADAHTGHGLLFGPPAYGHEVTWRTKRMILFAVGVDGVPPIHIDETLWTAVEILRSF